jgi:hypothetical protein
MYNAPMRWNTRLFAMLLANLIGCGGGGSPVVDAGVEDDAEAPGDADLVGRQCYLGGDLDDSQTVIASPALECPSRVCLQVALEIPPEALPEGSVYAPLCTAECEVDADCQGAPESPCQTGFTCAIPVVVGPFCCKRMCVCKDYLDIPPEGRPVPEACDPADPANTCVNLPGRGS